ncbi:MAG: MFS transporter [Bdellovibrionales bacterium]|nr:MFS transporter [Bdellovibrionales bacterium]
MVAAPRTPQQNKHILQVVFLTVFLDLVGFGLIIPIQPFLAESFGASPAMVTLLGAAYSGMQFLFAPFWGRLSDKIGRRPVMLTSIAFGAVGYALFGFAHTLPMLFFARMLSGFGNANIGAAQAIIADSTAPENRAKGMGLIGAAFGLGFIFGPALGGFFSQFGFAYPAFVASALGVFNLVLAWIRLPETHAAKGAVSQARRAVVGFSWHDLQRAMLFPHVIHMLAIYFLVTAGFSMMEQVLGLFVERNWISPDAVDHAKLAARLTTYVLIVVGVTATIVQGGLIGRIVKVTGERTLLRAGPLLHAFSFVGVVMVGAAQWYPGLLLCAVLMAVGSGFTNPSLSSLLSKLVNEEERGTVLGLGQSFGALGRAVGPLFAGLLFEQKASIPFFVAAGLMLACSQIVAFLPRSIGRASV